MHIRVRSVLGALCLLAAAPLLAGFAGTDLFLPNVGRQAGLFPSNWYTTIWVYNPGAEAATARIFLLERNTANPSPPFVDVLVAPGDTEKLENAVESLFHVQVFGALRVTCGTQKLVVTSRVYSKGAGAGEKDSVGQDFAGVPASFAIGAGEKTQVLGVHQTEPAADSDYRFNFGFVETTGHQANVRVSAFDGNGQLQGSEDLNVREFSQRQVAFKDHFPAVSTENVRLEMEVISGSGRIIAYGSGIANASQDPTTFEMTTELPALVHDATLAGAGTPVSPLGIAPGTSPGQVLTTVSGGAGPLGQVSTLAAGVSVAWQSPAVQPPGGPAGGALSGTYPNPGIASGQVVKSLNGMKDDVTLAAGANTTITPSGNTLTIGSSGLTLPYTGSASTASSAFAITNTGAGPAVTGSAPNANGVVGTSNAAGSAGVYGNNPNGVGVAGLANQSSGVGVYGENDAAGPGVWGDASNGIGVKGTSSIGDGVYGTSGSGVGVLGTSSGNYAGVAGYALGAAAGVYGSNDFGIGVFGDSLTSDGVYGHSESHFGVEGDSSGNYAGVAGYNHGAAAGVYGSNPSGYGGYFVGQGYFSGMLTKAGGGFKIDHPLDPSHRYLEHSFVESPDMKDVYDGVVTTDENGSATVTLPDWFGVLNRDFRYQLTVIGRFAQAIVEDEIADNRFTIRTNLANVKVSWQVTGIRQDAWANAHRLVVEEPKPGTEDGSYLHPELFGQPDEKSVEWARNPEMMRRLKERPGTAAPEPR